MIPKIIHYCWFGNSAIPEKDQKYIESWKRFCPDYEIKLWNESNYNVKKNKYMYDAYLSKKWGFVPDYARLDIIYTYGGIYLDTDVEIIRNIDDLLYNSAFMGFENGEFIAPGLGFGAKKNHPTINHLLHMYDDLSFIKEDGSLNLTPSPKFCTDWFVEKGAEMNDTMQTVADVTLYPSEFLCPKNYKTNEISLTKNTYSIHHYNASWYSEEQKLVLELYRKYVKHMPKVIAGPLSSSVAICKTYGIHEMFRYIQHGISRKIRRNKENE